MRTLVQQYGFIQEIWKAEVNAVMRNIDLRSSSSELRKPRERPGKIHGHLDIVHTHIYLHFQYCLYETISLNKGVHECFL